MALVIENEELLRLAADLIAWVRKLNLKEGIPKSNTPLSDHSWPYAENGLPHYNIGKLCRSVR